MTTRISRRDFLRSSAALGAGAALASTGAWTGTGLGRGLDFYQPGLDLAVVSGGTPARNCMAAVEALGGFSKFVTPGDKVVIKPNPIGTSPPEMALNTHPTMVEAVVRECVKAGAKEVIAISHDQSQAAVENGTIAAVERGGGTMVMANDIEQYQEIVIPRGRILRRELIARDVLDADVFINMPIAKHHAGAQVTFAMKNLMGVNWDRRRFHLTDLDLTIAELATAVKHSLVILDANHVLMTNGPGGPGEVKVAGQVVAGVDPLAVDAFATRYLDREPHQIRHIQAAYDLGVGEMDLDRLKIKEFTA